MMMWSLMSSDVGCRLTNCDQCLSMVQCCFTSTETVRLIRAESPEWPPRLSHSSWTLSEKVVGVPSYRLVTQPLMRSSAVEKQLKQKKSNFQSPAPPPALELFWANLRVQHHLPPLDLAWTLFFCFFVFSVELTECCFTSTETVGLLGTGAQDGHLDFHTDSDLCRIFSWFWSAFCVWIVVAQPACVWLHCVWSSPPCFPARRIDRLRERGRYVMHCQMRSYSVLMFYV